MPTLTLADPPTLRLLSPVNLRRSTSISSPFFCRPSRNNCTGPWRVRCAVAGESTISSSKVGDGNNYSPVDCVIVGAGISGLCIAQALATKHGDVGSNVIVTEARDRVGGNITTMEGDGYLWEEGPNSFQPSDSMLTMAVSFEPHLGCTDPLIISVDRIIFLLIFPPFLLAMPTKICSNMSLKLIFFCLVYAILSQLRLNTCSDITLAFFNLGLLLLLYG